ncbi:ABC transporter ATP-binding protein [Marinomonas colpomeniae]|uniref:ABC transporter ATP-binding protein n=1 Tax=Marinomonas colpomeniae TaxID=2774408 RepID=A0ABR8NYC5_9GAMM|nr:ABC transporter ATP-binding protein [Marinomonas colpomeniae]MBD5770620.1 ABC transporter ATP-binding protein [Marinomonas colpomeniae]
MFELTNVCVERNQRQILNIPHLELPSDKLCVILGHNGSGKTTLMQCLARQLVPDEGHITFNKQTLSQFSQRTLAQQIAFLPQQLPASSGLTVQELVQLGRFPWRGTWGRLQNEDNNIIEQSIDQVGIRHHAKQCIEDLSGGERQRAWIAMLLAQQSPVLLLDEPTSALDVAHQYELMNLLQTLNRETGQGMILILHDINLAARYADHILAMKKGEVFFQGSPEEIMQPDRLKDLYGIPMSLINHPKHNSKVAIVC